MQSRRKLVSTPKRVVEQPGPIVQRDPHRPLLSKDAPRVTVMALARKVNFSCFNKCFSSQINKGRPVSPLSRTRHAYACQLVSFRRRLSQSVSSKTPMLVPSPDAGNGARGVLAATVTGVSSDSDRGATCNGARAVLADIPWALLAECNGNHPC